MKIKDGKAATGLQESTVRYYERMGLGLICLGLELLRRRCPRRKRKGSPDQ